MERRDRRGRRIGRNWWREYVFESWHSAHQFWFIARENTALGYLHEGRQFDHIYPQPTLKSFMVALSNPERKYHGKEY